MPAIHPSQIEVVVDTREQAPWDFTAFGMRMRTGTLKHGDYSILGMERFISLERKSAEDFVGCMTSQRERFETELLALRGYRYRAIVVEAELDDILDSLWANDKRNLLHAKRQIISDRKFEAVPPPLNIRSRMKWEGAEGTVAAWIVRYCPIVFRRNRSAAERMAQRIIWEAAEAVYAPIEHLAPAPGEPLARTGAEEG